jgi:hypothetical protein
VATALVLVMVVGVIIAVLLLRRSRNANKGRPTRPAAENPIYGASAGNEFSETNAAVAAPANPTAASPSSREETRFIKDPANKRVSLVFADQHPESTLDATYSSPADVVPAAQTPRTSIEVSIAMTTVL